MFWLFAMILYGYHADGFEEFLLLSNYQFKPLFLILFESLLVHK